MESEKALAVAESFHNYLGNNYYCRGVGNVSIEELRNLAYGRWLRMLEVELVKALPVD